MCSSSHVVGDELQHVDVTVRTENAVKVLDLTADPPVVPEWCGRKSNTFQ
ncbi:MAG: hypothetical protein ACRD03_15495 [Acidimicrobiales bacterium]